MSPEPNPGPRPGSTSFNPDSVVSVVTRAQQRLAHRRMATTWASHRSRLLDCAQAVTGCRDSAEDVVQSAFLRLWEQQDLDKVQDRERFMFRVVRNIAIDWYRACTREKQWCVAGVENLAERSVQTITPEDSVEGARSLREVMDALGRLPGRMQNVLVMTRLEGLTQREVARRLEVSPTLVNFMLRDGTRHCRESICRPH